MVVDLQWSGKTGHHLPELDWATDEVWALNAEEAKRVLWAMDRATDGCRSARPLLHYAEVLSLRYLVTEKKEDKEEAEKALAEAMEVANDNVLSNVQDGVAGKIASFLSSTSQDKNRNVVNEFDNAVCKAHAMLYEACLLFRARSFVRGGIKVRQAWKYYERLLTRAEDMHSKGVNIAEESLLDLMGAYGGFLYVVSVLPSAFQTLLSYLGFESEREIGDAYIQRASQNPNPHRILFLVFSFWEESVFKEKRETSEAIYRQLDQSIHTSPLHHYLGGYLARKSGRIAEAESRFLQSQEYSAHVENLQLLTQYEMGWCRFLQCKWEDAISFLEPFLANFKSPSYRAYAGYQLGTALAMMDQHDRAVKVMEQVTLDVRNHFSFDVFSGRKAAEYIANGGLGLFERLVLIAEHALETHDMETLQNKVLELETACQDGEDRARLLYIQGRFARHQEDLEKAMKCFHAVIEVKAKIHKETYIIPHTYCEQGELCLERAQTVEERAKTPQYLDEAFMYFKQAKHVGFHYDFDKPLHRRLLLNMDQVKLMKQSIE